MYTKQKYKQKKYLSILVNKSVKQKSSLQINREQK